MVKINNLIGYICFNILISISFEKFCDKTQYCSECTICGKDDNNFCLCNFDNIFCKNEENSYTFLSEFLLGYDRCQIKNEEFNNICGITDINLEVGKNNTISFYSKNLSNILCYYNIKIVNNDNNYNLYINIKNENETNLDFSFYFVYYYLNKGNKKVFKLSNSMENKNFYYNINESNVERFSLYILINKVKNIDNISIDFYSEENTSFITKISNHKSNPISIIQIIFIVILSVTGVLIITLIILLIRRYISKKQIKSNCDLIINNNSNNKIDKEISISDIEKRNGEIMRNLYKNELSPKIYYHENFIKELYKCTICLENFREGASFFVTTKCGHYFHFNCFKNWIQKNIISPKCPNCNKPILENENIFNKNNLNITNPSSSSNSQITNSTHLTLNNGISPIEMCGKNIS